MRIHLRSPNISFFVALRFFATQRRASWKEKGNDGKEERGTRSDYLGGRETDWKRCVRFSSFFSLSLSSFSFLLCFPCDKAPFFYAELPKLFLTETRFPFMRTEPARVFLTGIEKGQRTLTESPLRLNQQLWHNTRADISVTFAQKRERERKREREGPVYDL